MMALVTREGMRVTKILVAGSGAVGKTTLVKVLKAGQSMDEMQADLKYHRTPFLELETINIVAKGEPAQQVPMLMVDVAGQLFLPIHALRELTNVALDRLSLVFLVFAADSLQSLIDLREWLNIIKSHFKDRPEETPQFVLLMNKCDIPSVVDNKLVEHLRNAEPNIIAYFETSCKTGVGIDDLKAWLAKRMTENIYRRNE